MGLRIFEIGVNPHSKFLFFSAEGPPLKISPIKINNGGTISASIAVFTEGKFLNYLISNKIFA